MQTSSEFSREILSLIPRGSESNDKSRRIKNPTTFFFFLALLSWSGMGLSKSLFHPFQKD